MNVLANTIVEVVASSVIGLIILVLAAIFVLARRTFYSILMLALIGTAVAAAMALLGYTYLAIFHLAMYVGATVTFLLMTMATIGEDVRETSIKHSVGALLGALAVVGALAAPAASLLYSSGLKPLPPETWSQLANMVFNRDWLVLLITIIAIASILVEVIAVARRR